MISPKERAAQHALSIYYRNRTIHEGFAGTSGFKRMSKVSHLVTTACRSSSFFACFDHRSCDLALPILEYMETTDLWRLLKILQKRFRTCSLERE
jgi:hypothetical protein